jgi:hypothetical protein
MKAWHFVSDTLRDGRPVPADGEVLVHEGPLKLCASGLHASKNILDALHYAPGSTICRVEVAVRLSMATTSYWYLSARSCGEFLAKGY